MVSSEHYVVSGSVGTTKLLMTPTYLVIDTGSGYNVIRRTALPPSHNGYQLSHEGVPALCDANGNPLDIQGVAVLRVRLGNNVFQVPFVVVEHLICPVIPGSHFLNRHVKAIWCQAGKLQIRRQKLPLVGHGNNCLLYTSPSPRDA